MRTLRSAFLIPLKSKRLQAKQLAVRKNKSYAQHQHEVGETTACGLIFCISGELPSTGKSFSGKSAEAHLFDAARLFPDSRRFL